MGHPDHCDCCRCQPPADFRNLPGAEELRHLRPATKRKKIYEKMKEQEDRVLRRIKSAPEALLHLEEPKKALSEEDEEVKAVILDTIGRFEKNKINFPPAEIRVALHEWHHWEKQNECPPSSLSRFLLCALVNFSDSEKFQEEVRSLMDQGAEKDDLRQLMVETGQPYARWESHVKGNPDAYIVRFLRDGTADLLDISRKEPSHQVEEADGSNQIAVRLSDCEVRKIMQRNGEHEKETGGRPGKVRPPYWPVALATDEQSRRYLSDEELDAIFPRWDRILTNPTQSAHNRRTWSGLGEALRAWVKVEKAKSVRNGIRSWPTPASRHDGEMGDPKAPSQVWRTVTRNAAYEPTSQGGSNTSRASTPEQPKDEQLELLRSMVEELKKGVTNLEKNMHVMQLDNKKRRRSPTPDSRNPRARLGSSQSDEHNVEPVQTDNDAVECK
ncbi:hypothetical protein N7490_011731 [Penicillium lividum]|nr:hypothetical protein N7490_011731 [Penicillium lividum]